MSKSTQEVILGYIYRNRKKITAEMSEEYKLQFDKTHYAKIYTVTVNRVEIFRKIELWKINIKKEFHLLGDTKVTEEPYLARTIYDVDITDKNIPSIISNLMEYLNELRDIKRKQVEKKAHEEVEKALVQYIEELTKTCHLVWHDTDEMLY